MLAEYSDDEIEVVLAHELAHHVHGDIWKGIAFESALIARRLLRRGSRARVRWARWSASRASPIPRACRCCCSRPAPYRWCCCRSRTRCRARHERRADRFALDLTTNPDAFISAMRRLGAQNLAEEQPSRIVQWLFYSHPPLGERIDAALPLDAGSTNVIAAGRTPGAAQPGDRMDMPGVDCARTHAADSCDQRA